MKTNKICECEKLKKALEDTIELWELAGEILNKFDDHCHQVRFMELHDPIGKIKEVLALANPKENVGNESSIFIGKLPKKFGRTDW